MSAERHTLEFGHERIAFTVIRRDRKTLEIAVEPDMAVTIVAPRDADIETIRERLRKRAPWVLKQQRYFSAFLPRTPERRYLPGETHLYLGRQYRLKVVPHIQRGVKLTRGRIVVQSHYPGRTEVTRELVEAWFRERAHIKFRERIEDCIGRFPDPEMYRPRSLIVRQLQRRWGEPHLVCRRLQLLSRMEHHEQDDEQIFPRSARTCRTDGFGQRGAA